MQDYPYLCWSPKTDANRSAKEDCHRACSWMQLTISTSCNSRPGMAYCLPPTVCTRPETPQASTFLTCRCRLPGAVLDLDGRRIFGFSAGPPADVSHRLQPA